MIPQIDTTTDETDDSSTAFETTKDAIQSGEIADSDSGGSDPTDWSDAKAGAKETVSEGVEAVGATPPDPSSSNDSTSPDSGSSPTVVVSGGLPGKKLLLAGLIALIGFVGVMD